MESMAKVEPLCYGAVAISGVMTLGVVAASGMAMYFIMKVGNSNLEKIAQELPKAVNQIKECRIPVQVLIALCEQAGVSKEDIAAIYKKESKDRKQTVDQTFGADNKTVDRFKDWESSKFLKDGYAGEDILKHAGSE